MRLPLYNDVERAVFAASYAQFMAGRTSTDISAAEEALESALWAVKCFKRAVRTRGGR